MGRLHSCLGDALRRRGDLDSLPQIGATPKRITKFNCRFHRNGTSGEGFHLCEFTGRTGRFVGAFHAVVFEAPGQCAVFEESSIETRWRGADDFESKLRKLIAESDESGASFSHGHIKTAAR
ncbi:MAG: hypothetical protein KGL39_05075 [Patescibacteria group bacterium]|nr:hypothetical protein [Patescibacteria group bacterium]